MLNLSINRVNDLFLNAIADGTIQTSRQADGSLGISHISYHPQFFCSPGEGNICYFPLRDSSGKNLKVGRIDFDSPDNHFHLTITGSEYVIYSGVAFSDDQA